MIYEKISPVGAFQFHPISSALLINKAGDKFYLWQIESDSNYAITPITVNDNQGNTRVVAYQLNATIYYMLNKYVLGLSADGSRLIDALDKFNAKDVKLILNCGSVNWGQYSTDLQDDIWASGKKSVLGEVFGEHYIVTDFNCSVNSAIESLELRSRTKLTIKSTFRSLKDISNLDGTSELAIADKKTIIQSFLNAVTE